MPDGLFEVRKNAATNGDEPVRVPMHVRALKFAVHAWRPAASVMAVTLALLLVWHGVNGKNGLRVWQQKRVEDQQLRKDIDDLNRENTRLRDRVERLKSNPDAIGVVPCDKRPFAFEDEALQFPVLPSALAKPDNM